MSDSDTESDSSIISENSSIFNDLEQLITSCHEIHSHTHGVEETLKNLYQLVANHTNIVIEYNNKECDLDTILEELHATVLKSINETGKNNFGELVLNMLSTAKFNS